MAVIASPLAWPSSRRAEPESDPVRPPPRPLDVGQHSPGDAVQPGLCGGRVGRDKVQPSPGDQERLCDDVAGGIRVRTPPRVAHDCRVVLAVQLIEPVSAIHKVLPSVAVRTPWNVRHRRVYYAAGVSISRPPAGGDRRLSGWRRTRP